jgi:hypothetical protein
MSNYKLEDWMLEAAELMARTGISLSGAVTQLGLIKSIDECNVLLRRATFQRVLWESRHRFFSELGSNPNYKKESAIGKLLSLSEKLETEGKFDAAAEVVFKIAKMNGWTGPESTVNVFGDLSQKDIDNIRKKLSKPAEYLSGEKKVN